MGGMHSAQRTGLPPLPNWIAVPFGILVGFGIGYLVFYGRAQADLSDIRRSHAAEVEDLKASAAEAARQAQLDIEAAKAEATRQVVELRQQLADAEARVAEAERSDTSMDPPTVAPPPLPPELRVWVDSLSDDDLLDEEGALSEKWDKLDALARALDRSGYEDRAAAKREEAGGVGTKLTAVRRALDERGVDRHAMREPEPATDVPIVVPPVEPAAGERVITVADFPPMGAYKRWNRFKRQEWADGVAGKSLVARATVLSVGQIAPGSYFVNAERVLTETERWTEVVQQRNILGEVIKEWEEPRSRDVFIGRYMFYLYTTDKRVERLKRGATVTFKGVIETLDVQEYDTIKSDVVNTQFR